MVRRRVVWMEDRWCVELSSLGEVCGTNVIRFKITLLYTNILFVVMLMKFRGI
jgi:hypothetical protein